MALAAGISAAGSLGGAFLQSNAAQQAAQTQANAQMQALALANANLQPIIAQGKALTSLAMPGITGLVQGGGAAQQALENFPGFQFALGQTEKAGMNAGTVMGLGGNTAYGIMQAALGLASGTEAQYFNQLNAILNSGLQTQVGAAGTLTGAQTSAITGAANAQAAGTLGSANALAGGLGGLSNAGLILALGSRTGGGTLG